MTLSNIKYVKTHPGDAVTTVFNYDFLIPLATDFKVELNDTVANTTVTLSSSVYSISGIGSESYGNVTYPLVGSPMPATENLIITRVIPLHQNLDIQSENGFDPETFEIQLDRIVMMMQQAEGLNGTNATFAVGTTSTLTPGSSATIVNSGTSVAAILDFGIPRGITGEKGYPGLPFDFAVSTTMTDPTTAKVRFNHATPASVTAIAINDLVDLTGNPDFSAFITTWADSTSTTGKGHLIIRSVDDDTKIFTYIITALADNTPWSQITVTYLSGSAVAFTTDENISIAFTRYGDAGVGDVVGPVSSLDNTIARYSGTDGKLIQGSGIVIDDSDNIYGMGNISVTSADILHTATQNDEHAVEMDVDAAGFGDVKALDINYTTGTITTGDDEAVILINIDETLATGGEVFGLEVLSTEGAADGIHALKAGATVAPIIQESGSFANPTTGTNNTTATDVADMIDGSTGTNTTIFVADNDYILIGAVAAFTEIEFIIETGAENPGITPVFEYSTAGSHQFTMFSPVDGTNGFKNTGVVAWDAADLSGHVVNDDTGTFDIKITRTHNSKGNVSLFYAKTAATVVYAWDEDGNVSIAKLTTTGVIELGDETDTTIARASAGKISVEGITLLDTIDQGQVAGINTQTGTTYTLADGDQGKVVEMNNASANTLTVPPNSSVAFALNTKIDVAQYGAGLTTIAQGAGVTIRSSGALLALGGQYSAATLYKRGTNEWVLIGDLA